MVLHIDIPNLMKNVVRKGKVQSGEVAQNASGDISNSCYPNGTIEQLRKLSPHPSHFV